MTIGRLKDDKVSTPTEAIPSRFWNMSNEIKQWVTVGHSLEEKAILLRQITNAEEQKKM
jgi:hypothetical protein